MFNPQNPEILELNRQRKLADLLTSQGMQTPQAQTVAGNVYVPTNPMEYLGKLFNVYAGTKANEALDTKEQAIAKALREQAANEVSDIVTLAKGRDKLPSQVLAGPAYNGAAPSIEYPAIQANPDLAMSRALLAQSPQAQRLVEPLLKAAMPEPTTLEKEYKAATAQGYKGTINDFKNQMSEADKARIAQGWASHNLALAKFADETGGAYGARPTQTTINPGSPVLTKPNVSLAPNAPAYAQNAVTMQPQANNGYALVQNFNNSLVPPAGIPPKAQREWNMEANKPLTGEPAKQVTGAVNTIGAIDNYRKILNDYSKLSSLNPEQRANLSSAYNTMVLQSKEANALGVLNGQDYEILKSLAPNPNDISNLLVSNKVLSEQAAKQRDFMGNVVVNAYGIHQKRIPDYVANKIKPIEEDIKPTPVPSNVNMPKFSSEAEAAKAGIKKGTRVVINGVVGTWE